MGISGDVGLILLLIEFSRPYRVTNRILGDHKSLNLVTGICSLMGLIFLISVLLQSVASVFSLALFEPVAPWVATMEIEVNAGMLSCPPLRLGGLSTGRTVG